MLSALAVHVGIALLLDRLATRPPPQRDARSVVEVVRLPDPVAETVPEPAPEPARPAAASPAPSPPDPSPAPPPRAIPAPELPASDSRSGVVALDCEAVFDEAGRAIACAGGEITLGFEADEEALRAIASEVPSYGPARAAGADAGFGRAPDARMTVGPAALRRLRGGGRGGTTPISEAAEEAFGAEAALGFEAEDLDPPSLVTSFEEQKRVLDTIERRDDARVRREVERQAEGR